MIDSLDLVDFNWFDLMVVNLLVVTITKYVDMIGLRVVGVSFCVVMFD